MMRVERVIQNQNQVHVRSYLVRPARYDDIPAIAELESIVFGSDAYSENRLYQLMSEACPGCGTPRCAASGITNRIDPISRPSNCYAMYVADTSEIIIGCSSAQVRIWNEFLSDYGIDPSDVHHLDLGGSSRIGYLKSIAVHPDYRRLGIGKRFHAARDAFLRDHNVRYVFLLQMPSPGLVDFHHSLGFQEISASPSLEYLTGGRARLWYRSMA